jgi:hypothetical protein
VPTYNFRDKKTNKVTRLQMTIAEMEEFTANHPNLEQVVSFPGIVSGISTRTKPDKGFRSILSNIKKRNPKGNTNDFGG